MRETGNNKHKNDKILSIRLSSDGLSFSVISPTGGTEENNISFGHNQASAADALKRVMESHEEFSKEFSSVQIFLDTAYTVYVPAEVVDADPGSGETWLNSAGIYTDKSDRVIISSAVGDVCAVMVFDCGVIDCLKAKFGDKAVFFSPLQENIEMKGRFDTGGGGAYIVNLTGKNLYITSFDDTGGLSIAEVYPYNSDADIVYYLHKLSGGGKEVCRHLRIYVYGDYASVSIRSIKKYFRGAVCV